MTRYRVQQVRDRSQEVNRLCKVLEDAGLKLTTVISDVMGKSGRAMLQALVDGPMLTALDTIPGVDRIGAISIVAETGGDMTRFLTAGHLCSWGAMCPGQNESAGKRRSGKTRKGKEER